MSGSINQRKSEHIDITLNEKVTGNDISTGFETLKFIHNALPEIDFNEIEIKTTFLEHDCKTPFLISSMTGGSEFAETINQNLAIAAEERGWALALGSMRALIESKDHQSSFQMRKYAPSIPIIANLGAVQLNYGFGIEECQRIIDMTEADSLVLQVVDSGVGLAQEHQEGQDRQGFGTAQVRERLAATYGTQGAIKIVAESNGGTRATVIFPLNP